MGLAGLMMCGCMSNQELKDWGKRTAAKQKEKEAARKELESRQIKSVYDPYTTSYKVTGKEFKTDRDTAALFRAGLSKSGDLAYCQLYVHHASIDGWKNLDAAFDIEANKLPAQRISSTVVGGWECEDVAVDLTRNYLGAHRENGLNIKLKGTRGELIVIVPSLFVRGFLSGLEDEIAAAKNHNEPISQAK